MRACGNCPTLGANPRARTSCAGMPHRPTEKNLMHPDTRGLVAGSRMARATARTALQIAAALIFAAGATAATAATAGATAGGGTRGTGIGLQVTLGTDLSDGACGTDTQLDVTRLDQVNFCYRVTNLSDVALNYHTLADDVLGNIFSAIPHTLVPGATTQYNRIITARESQSPTSTWTAYSVHPGYAFGDSPIADRVFADGFDGPGNGATGYDWVDITATGTPLDMLGSGFPVNVPIGFPFTYYGQTSDQIVASLEGGFLFGVTEGYLTFQNTSLPNPDIGAAILPYWTDIEYPQPEDGNTYVQTLGTAPNRRFVIEWFNVPIVIGGIAQDGATFEAILHEGSNQIVFQYADTDVGDPARNDGITATIGLNPPPGVEAALQYSYLTASVSGGRAILFSPSTPMVFTSTQQVVLDVGVPKITVDPVQFTVSAPAGGSTQGTLTIGNIGDRALTWNIGSFSGNEHLPPVSRFTLPMGDPTLTRGGPAPRAPKAARAKATQVPLSDPVPAFAIDLGSSSLVSLDAANPAVVTPIAGIGDLILTAGAFVDEDFSKLYAIDFYTWHLMTIDTRDGTTGVIGTAVLQNQAGWNWDSLAWDSTTSTLYGVADAPNRDGSVSTFLYTLDPVTANAVLIGQISGVGDPVSGTLVSGLAVDSNGLMYGIDLVADDFVAIDKTNATAAVVSSLGFDANYAQGLDFDDYTGTLYYAAFDASTAQAEMYTIDPPSGALTPVAPIGADPANTQLSAFAIARLGGVCAYPNDVPWLAFSTTRGSTVAGGSTPVQVTFDASVLPAGTYNADICVANNDLTNRRVAVPVTLTVN
jgi:hypothetical protein